MSEFWRGFIAGVLAIPALYVFAWALAWLAGLPRRLFGIFVDFGAFDDETYPERSYGSMRAVRRIGRIVQVGYYRHGWDWESRFIGVAVGKVGLAIGRRRALAKQAADADTEFERLVAVAADQKRAGV